MFDRREEALFFQLEYPFHAHLLCGQFGKCHTHFSNQVGHHVVKERFASAELVAVTYRAADDPAQYIAAAFVAGDHAVGDQKGTCADMVGEYAAGLGWSRLLWLVSRAAALISAWNRSIS